MSSETDMYVFTFIRVAFSRCDVASTHLPISPCDDGVTIKSITLQLQSYRPPQSYCQIDVAPFMTETEAFGITSIQTEQFLLFHLKWFSVSLLGFWSDHSSLTILLSGGMSGEPDAVCFKAVVLDMFLQKRTAMTATLACCSSTSWQRALCADMKSSWHLTGITLMRSCR